MTVFEKLNQINVNDKTEIKDNGTTKLTYLSWAWAWAEVKKVCPDAQYEIKKFENNLPYVYDEKTGYMVFTSVTIENMTHEMWLPVMDSRNNAILQPKMTEINKTIMRCLTKNLAMFGLGLYIYAGEDLPEMPKNFEPLTEKELREKWGVQDVEKTIKWYERQLKIPYAEWSAEECEAVRTVLAEQKVKRGQKEAK